MHSPPPGSPDESPVMQKNEGLCNFVCRLLTIYILNCLWPMWSLVPYLRLNIRHVEQQNKAEKTNRLPSYYNWMIMRTRTQQSYYSYYETWHESTTPDQAYMCHSTSSPLVQVRACHLSWTKLLRKPMMTYCQSEPRNTSKRKDPNGSVALKLLPQCHGQNIK